MALLEKLARVADKVLTIWIVGCLSIMVLTIISEVFLRSTISYSLTWNIETSQYCLINLTYVGSALAFRRRAHISINTVTTMLPRRIERWAEVVGRLLVLPFLVILAYSGVQILQHAKGVTPTLRLPMAVYYLPILVGAILLCFYAVVQIAEVLAEARAADEAPAAAGTPRGAV